MNALLSQYSDQITEIALFAKRINFDLNGDMKELVRLWLNDSKKFYELVQDNKDDVNRLMKKLVTKSK